MAKTGIGSHETHTIVGSNDEWLTPPEIITSLGTFDLDPCAPVIRPWDTALQHYTIEDNGLFLPWHGRVWMNPPYGKVMSKWLNKIALHGNGIALTFARTDTEAFHNYVFQHASSMLFLSKRITFYRTDGTKGSFNGGAPSVLIAYGKENMEALGDSGLKGKHLLVNYTPVIVVGIDRTWKTVVSLSFEKLNGEASLEAIYTVVEKIAPDKIRNNGHYKAKVRQTLQTYFTKIKRGFYSQTNSEEI
jgi:hypothetical protein